MTMTVKISGNEKHLSYARRLDEGVVVVTKRSRNQGIRGAQSPRNYHGKCCIIEGKATNCLAR